MPGRSRRTTRRDAGLPVPAHHRAQGRPGGIHGAGRDRLEHVEGRAGHDPRRSADRTEAGDELGHRPRLVADRAAYTAVDGAETDEERATPSPEDHPADPRTAHGRSEHLGGRAVLAEPSGASAVARTPWPYGLHGTNFVRTMIGPESRRPTVDVLDGRRGQPTRSTDVTERTAGLGARPGDGRHARPATGAVLPRPAAPSPIRKELSQ
ncbi:sugar nucleotide-binding protein [Streptomyces sp. NPDC057236]|uniref:sugar nucleotide-binding protein n=1 Tax=Streptomyces sp. NPDC057236 TaxID=3346059 RepID=UPI00364302A4